MLTFVNRTQNAPGKNVINLCKEKSLVIANHLSYSNRVLGGNLSYRKGKNWISELDLCLMHEKSLPLIKEVRVRQEIKGSDHAPLCVTMDIKRTNLIAPFLLNRAKYLGQSYITPQHKHNKLQKTESSRNVDLNNFKSYMTEHQPPALTEDDLDSALNTSLKVICEGAKNAKKDITNSGESAWDQSQPRWKNLLERNDSGTIWKAINWKGKISDNNTTQPSDEEFKLHFEDLLNTDQGTTQDTDLSDSPYIPVLDNPFTLPELDSALKDLGTGKSYTGICPGLLVGLPMAWLVFFLTLFNVVFQGLRYPVQWTYSKLITLFKSGNRMTC